jgi:tight adherence protein B
MSPTLFLLAASIVIAVGAVIGLFAVLKPAQPKSSDQIEARLRAYRTAGPATANEQSNVSLLNRAREKTVSTADRVITKRGLTENLTTSLSSAAIAMRPAEWVVLHTGAAVGTMIVFFFLSGATPIAALVGLALGAGAPFAYLKVKQGRRRSAFYSALPDMLLAVSGSLRSGHALPQAFESAAKHTSGPMSEELQRALIEVRLGRDIEEALRDVALRMRSNDLEWAVMAIRIQKEVGGNLSELLKTVAATLRERDRLRRQVKTLSAEGRLSGIILVALPILVVAALAVINPDYLSVLLGNLFGLLVLSAAVIAVVVGGIWIKKIVDVDV